MGNVSSKFWQFTTRYIWFVVFLQSVLMIGCSNQWRDADTGRSADEILGFLDEIESEVANLGSGSSVAAEFFRLKNSPDVNVYFAEGPGPLGPVASILSFANFEVFGSEFFDLAVEDISKAMVFFIDLPSKEGHENGLLIDFLEPNSDQPVTRFFVNSELGKVSDGSFQVTLQDEQGEALVLRSFDVDEDGDFNDVIQLRVSDFDPGTGEERLLGKISTLVGYSLK